MEDFFDYKWPLDGADINTYVPFQVAKRFLKGEKFSAQTPGLMLKTMGSDEVRFLEKQGFSVTSRQTIPLAKLLTHMKLHCSAKYSDYMSSLHKKALDECNIGAKVPTAPEFMKKVVDSKRSLAQRAIRKAAHFNAELSQQRRLERGAYYDTQTQLVHYPECKRPCRRPRPPTAYPVAVLPGQYQDFCPRYTSEQLNCMPLSKMNSAPPAPPTEAIIPPTRTASGASGLTAGATSSASSSGVPMSRTQSGEASASAAPATSGASTTNLTTSMQPPLSSSRLSTLSSQAKRNASMRHDPICGLCLKGPERNRKGEAEALIYCSTCQNSGHPSCLELSPQAVRILHTYSWQCMECKVCTLCSDPGDEDKMMFCDDCDRGYHTFCVGLQDIPTGHWVCGTCSTCSSCRKHSPDCSRGNPCTHHFSTPRDGSEPKFACTLCISCSKLFRVGHFCPVCLRVYHNDESDEPMVCCDHCDRWIHTECDSISADQYSALSKEQSTYKCILCRGTRPERMDNFHKKYRGAATRGC